MLKKLPGIAALLCLLAPATLAQAPARSAPRVTAMYTTWDDYYFYAGFQVHDPNVISTNTTPTSQPQQDDDIEVFFETDNARATVRTPQTYQMAVSAGNGAYFSVGDGTKVPKAKVVYTYKYAAQVDGTLNNPTDTDIGYTRRTGDPLAGTGPGRAAEGRHDLGLQRHLPRPRLGGRARRPLLLAFPAGPERGGRAGPVQVVPHHLHHRRRRRRVGGPGGLPAHHPEPLPGHQRLHRQRRMAGVLAPGLRHGGRRRPRADRRRGAEHDRLAVQHAAARPADAGHTRPSRRRPAARRAEAAPDRRGAADLH